MIASAVVFVAAVLGWVCVFVPPRTGIWVRSWAVAAVLSVLVLAVLRRTNSLTDAIGPIDPGSALIGVGVGVGWVVATQVGHIVLCRILPSFIDQVRSLYSIADGDRRRDIALALVAMALAEELVFRLVIQRELGVVVGVACYAAVQIVERNGALIAAGAACGVVFGVLYAWQDTLVAPLAAHIVWTGTLMFVWPLRGCSLRPVPEADGVAITTDG